jgi:hypothetical protein
MVFLNTTSLEEIEASCVLIVWITATLVSNSRLEVVCLLDLLAELLNFPAIVNWMAFFRTRGVAHEAFQYYPSFHLESSLFGFGFSLPCFFSDGSLYAYSWLVT